MLHTGILPHHTRWTRLFENLRYIVIDELHTYRGVFGSHLCNVLRRLRRIARFYGRDPQFICCSATIANPGDLASRLLESEVEVLNVNGAPAAEKTFVFYNPPVVNRALGIRRSYINEASRVAQEFLKRDLQTMVFANSRLHTEILLTYFQPDNLEILINHLKCAAFELPITPRDKFGDVDLPDLCARLAEAGFLHLAGDNFHWTQEAYPADTISLRSVTSDNFVIVDVTAAPNVIGEIDFPSALAYVHEKAIYLHGGQQHHVEHLDFKERKAFVKRVDVDYYTDAVRYTQVRILEVAAASQQTDAVSLGSAHSRSHGDVLVRSQVVGFKKIKFFTNETIGDGKLELPENEMHTTSYWITLERPLLDSLPFTVSERQSGMFGLLQALESVATLLLMCDCRDLGTAIGERPFILRPLKVAVGPSSYSSDPHAVIPSEAKDHASLSISSSLPAA